MWLAENGWRVVAVDISDTALRRAAAAAQSRGVADRIEFAQHDLSESFPDGSFDLVSAQFLHSTLPLDRPRILRDAAAAVRPGGTLLIVDHAGPPPWASKLHHHHEFPSADEVLAALDLPNGEWERVRVEASERQATGPDGQTTGNWSTTSSCSGAEASRGGGGGRPRAHTSRGVVKDQAQACSARRIGSPRPRGAQVMPTSRASIAPVDPGW